MAIILNLDRTITHQTATSHPDQFGEDGMNLDAMQAVVGGYIEHVMLYPAYVSAGISYKHLVVNEEGKLEGLPTNSVATDIALEHGLRPDDFIVGPAILLTDEEFQ
jgi:hypothetical protein